MKKKDRVLAALFVTAGLIALAVILTHPWVRTPPPDPAAVLAAHNRGVGLMEQFEYFRAVDAFEEAVRLDPDRIPGRVNLGIALLNTANDANLGRAVELFDGVLRQEPGHRHALYGRGLIALYRQDLPRAYADFAAVNRLDPHDAHTWYHLALTHPDGPDSPAAREALVNALKSNPYLNAARYKLAFHPLTPDDERKRLLEEKLALERAEWESEFRAFRYTEVGKYSEVIGRSDPPRNGQPVGPLPVFAADEAFRVTLAPGARWAVAADFGAGDLADLRRAVRRRFGAALVLWDYDGDGRTDLYLPGAAAEGGRVRDLLLHNEGDGRLTDVTTAAGLAGDWPSLGASAADFDNDGKPDLLVTTAGGPKLFRNSGAGAFEDVTARAGLDRLTDVCLAATWIDLDQDGDLDLVLARYADSPPAALARLRDGAAVGTGGVAVFLNTGVAPPTPRDKPLQGLTSAFRRIDGPPVLLAAGAVVQVAAGDFDGDSDVDLVVLADGAAPGLVQNDRLMRFTAGPRVTPDAARWNGALVLDVSSRGRSDLLLRAGQPPLLLHPPAGADTPGAWEAGVTNAPPLRQAQAVDLDLDGRTDVVGLSDEGRPVLLHNDGTGRLAARPEAFGPADALPADAVAAVAADLDGACRNDLLLWSEAGGLRRWRSAGNGNRAVTLRLNGLLVRDGSNRRTNADGLGTGVTVQAGPVVASAEVTTLSAGLGQSQPRVQLGVGPATKADVVRLRWPDGVPQAELDVPACQLVPIVETNRKGTSCPVLFVWDGRKFAYVTDCLGAGALGELGPDGSTRPPRPEESVLIEPGRLVPRDGYYCLKLAEPLDELLYLDRLRLVALDHPADWAVVPDERFVVTGPPPSQGLLAFRDRAPPARAVDHRGRDVTEQLRRRDERYVDGFDLRSWLGFAGEHWVELDFGDAWDRLAVPGGRLFLVLAGGTDYAYPESIYAADQAGVSAVAPVLERLSPDGRWEPWGEIGFPAGLPKVMTREVTGLPPGRLRVRTNLRVYWDQVLLARLAEVAGGQVRVQPLEPSGVALAAGGFQREVRRPGHPFIEYDDGQRAPVPVTAWHGSLTRLGDVTELVRRADDRLVLCGPGEEVTAHFDARNMPPLPAGWVRSFVLRVSGYCKDTSPFTRTGGRVGPLPFRAMPGYPYGPELTHPAPNQVSWHTRPAGLR